MTYTFLSAQYANEQNTAITADTAEAGTVALSVLDTPVDWQVLLDSGLKIQPYVATVRRRLVLKSLIIQRLIDAGKIDVAKVALDSSASAYARWWAPDKPTIFFDDPEALALLQSIGADPAVILAE